MTQALLDLARQKTPEALAELVVGISEIIFRNVDSASDTELNLFSEISLLLYATLPTESRIELSRQMASQQRAPVQLAMKLAEDEEDIARPMLTHGACFSQEDLVELVQRVSKKHLEFVACRRDIDTKVSDELIKRGTKTIRRILASNRDIRLSRLALQALVKNSEEDVVLREDLVLRPDLTPRLCERMLTFVDETTQKKLRGILSGSLSADDREQIARFKQLRRDFGPSLDTLNMRKLWKLAQNAGVTLDELITLLLEDDRLPHVIELVAYLSQKSVSELRHAIYKGGAEVIAAAANQLEIKPKTFTLLSVVRCRHLGIPESQADEWVKTFLNSSPDRWRRANKNSSAFAASRGRREAAKQRRNGPNRQQRLAAI